MMTDVEKQECYRKVDKSLEKSLQECHPAPPTCYETAREWYEGEMARCETTFADPRDCEDEATAQYEEMITECEIAECEKKAREEVEASFDCDSPLVDPDTCEAEKKEVLAELLANCRPQDPQVETACGFVDVDTRLDDYNALQL
jgi:hypothetical protein